MYMHASQKIVCLLGERASGSVVALAVARLPASIRSPVIATLVSHRVLRPMCVGVRVCGGVRVSQYGTFRDYSSSLVCVESGGRERPKSYMTPQCS